MVWMRWNSCSVNQLTGFGEVGLSGRLNLPGQLASLADITGPGQDFEREDKSQQSGIVHHPAAAESRLRQRNAQLLMEIDE